jgi:hypothetical protein
MGTPIHQDQSVLFHTVLFNLENTVRYGILMRGASRADRLAVTVL